MFPVSKISGAAGALALALATLAAQPAAAATDILFASIPDLTVSYDILFCSSCGGGEQVFDSFSPTRAGAASQVTVALESLSLPASVDVSLFDGAPDSLGAQLAGFTVDLTTLTGADSGNDTTVFTFDLPTLVTLSKSHTYSISFYNSDFLFIPGYSGGGSASYQAGAPLGFGTSSGFELDGQASDGSGGGTVPEPATWGLMVLGFGGLGACLRRRRAGYVVVA